MPDPIALIIYLIGFLAVFVCSADDPRMRGNEAVLAGIAFAWPIFALISVAFRMIEARHG